MPKNFTIQKVRFKTILGRHIKSLQRPLLDTFINGRKHTQVSPHSQYDHITLIHYMSGQEFRLTVKFINRLSSFDVSYQYIVESHEQEPDAIYPEHRQGKYCSLPCRMIGGSLMTVSGEA